MITVTHIDRLLDLSERLVSSLERLARAAEVATRTTPDDLEGEAARLADHRRAAASAASAGRTHFLTSDGKVRRTRLAVRKAQADLAEAKVRQAERSSKETSR